MNEKRNLIFVGYNTNTRKTYVPKHVKNVTYI